MSDFKIDTQTGEFILNAQGDFDIVTGDSEIAQLIMMILKTSKGDWTLTPNFGANLEQFIGTPLDDATLIDLEETVQKELDKYPNIFVRQVSALKDSEHAIMLVVDVKSVETNEIYTLLGNLDLKTGEVTVRTELQ